MMSNKPSGGVTPKLDKWPMSKLVWSQKNYFTAITDPILSECSWFCFPVVAWISKMQKKKRSKATSSHTPLKCLLEQLAIYELVLHRCQSMHLHADSQRFTSDIALHHSDGLSIKMRHSQYFHDFSALLFLFVSRTGRGKWVIGCHWVIPGCLPYTFPSRKQEEEEWHFLPTFANE